MVGQTVVSSHPLEKGKYTFSSKSNASREVELWGKDYDSLTDPTMRSAGQLTENVTEARMLQTKIMDMSKERYKYITQADFNMKFFLDGQRRKARLMPQLLSGVDVEYWLNKKTARHVPKYSSTSSAKFAFLDRLEASGEKCKDFDQEEENPFALPEKPTKPPEKQLPEFYRIRLKEMEDDSKEKTTFPTQPLFRPQTHKVVKFCEAKQEPVKLPSVTKSAKPASSSPNSQITSAASDIKSDDRASRLANRAKSSPARPNIVHKVVQDSRYIGLEGSLCRAYTSNSVDTLMVQSVIDSHDSLHTPSKHSTANSRPKLQRTILEYLRERGFDV